MSVLVVISTPNAEAPDSAPRRIVDALPSIEIDVVHIGSDTQQLIPYLWVRETSPAAFTEVLERDPTIGGVHQLDAASEGAFFKVEWTVDSPLVACILDSDGVIMEANGSAEAWRLKLWFEDRQDPSSFQRCCEKRDIPLEVTRISSVTGELVDGVPGLSDSQREALTLAFERGYFEEPRAASQGELAEEFDITPAALGRLLRRGHRNLVRDALID